MNSLIKSLVVISMIIVSAIAQDIQIYKTKNANGQITPATIEKTFQDAGFYITANNNMNLSFNAKFKVTNHQTYNLMVVHREDLVSKLIEISPKAVLLTPISMSIYSDKNSDDISISTISLDGMAKITGISKSNKYLKELINSIKTTLKKALPNGHFEKLTYKILKPQGKLVSTFIGEIDVEASELEEELEGFQEEIEGSLESLGFVIAGFNTFGDMLKKSGNNKYDFFDAYSICKIPVIFEVSKTHPEAGAFAPCTLYMYKEKDSTEVHIAFPSVYNWISSVDIKDKPSKKVLIDAQNMFINSIKESVE